jgi:uncharacterized protein YggE
MEAVKRGVMMNRKNFGGLAVAGTLVALGVFAAGCGDRTTRVETGGGVSQTGISVTGEGKVSGKPDVAKLTLGVTAESNTVQQARDQAANSLDGIVASLKKNGVAEKDLQTQQLNIEPQYNYNNGDQKLRGFRVTNVLNVTLRDINKTSQVVDDAVKAGGNETTIQGLAFTIDNPEDLKKQAREKAVADAKAKAQTLAQVAGVSIGAAMNISENSNTPVFYDTRSAAGALAAPDVAKSTPIQPGELDVTVNVAITWAIK